MGKRLENKTALVTGGSRGIGRAIVFALADEGANVIFTYRKSTHEAQNIVEDLCSRGANVACLEVDFQYFDPSSLLSAAQQINSSIDVLVNNVGMLTRDAFLNISPENFDEVINTNLKWPFFLCQKFSEALISKQRSGSIINISSLSSIMCRSRVAHYQVAKAGLNMLTKSVAFELAQYNIRCNSLIPGLTRTTANEDQWRGDPEVWQQRVSSIPLNRPGIPEDYAGMAVFLASNESSWLTGADIVIDGGMSLG